MSDSAAVAQTSERPELKRVMGPGLLLLFVVGDILGTGVYALTGKVAGEVGGAVWLPFLCAFVVALLTATSYLELVTKYPKAGGAAVYTHKAFGIHFLTFLLTFAVMCSGLTSASSASKAFAANFFSAAHIDPDRGALLMITALAFMTLIALVNLRGVGESVKANVVLTCVELSGLLIVIAIGAWALIGGDGDTSRLTEFHTPEGDSAFGAVTAATALAFFAMVGFEDSVNMAEETKDPVRIFPKIMLIGLCITGVIYVLVAISAVALVSPDELNKGATPLLKVVQAGAPGFPLELFAWITMFAVANSALINMLMASRLLYGMSHEQVLPGPLGRVLRKRRTPWIAILFTTLLAFILIGYADLAALGGTTAFLLLCVFAIVNVAVLVLRRDRVEHKHFHAPTALPVLGVVLCVYLASPLSGRASADYKIAGWLMLVGVGLWIITWLLNKYVFNRHPDFDPSHLDPQGPVN
ncbi:APC family permease [Kribbella sindirgiensis]|uniref:APC family permease n=1 Tax=Kribbella sindirgiensis TaxID=1124744 RepID=A0A4R0IBC5_9ACTN|nr:APC family permease [Kribbella sindirgiensis]TCC26111.1 APC family permease [Kribbella sindirgiensis]